jgi:hypothetical protein
MGCLSLELTPLDRNVLTFRHPSYFAVARVVEGRRAFAVACHEGGLIDNTVYAAKRRESAYRQTAEGIMPMLVCPPCQRCSFCTLLIHVKFGARTGHVNVMRELLDCGLDVDAITDSGTMSTALQRTSFLKHLDAVRFLLQRGACVDPVNGNDVGVVEAYWLISEELKSDSSLDIFDLFSEASAPEASKEYLRRGTIISYNAAHACGVQIHSLVRLRANVAHLDNDERVRHAWLIAAISGFYYKYSAILPYHDDDIYRTDWLIAAELLWSTSRGKARFQAELFAERVSFLEQTHDAHAVAQRRIQSTAVQHSQG